MVGEARDVALLRIAAFMTMVLPESEDQRAFELDEEIAFGDDAEAKDNVASADGDALPAKTTSLLGTCFHDAQRSLR